MKNWVKSVNYSHSLIDFTSDIEVGGGVMLKRNEGLSFASRINGFLG